MSAIDQYKEFLEWLKAKRRELVGAYWNESCDAQRLYRGLLLKIQVEIWETETVLRRLQNV